jgi:hypothetical protein
MKILLRKKDLLLMMVTYALILFYSSAARADMEQTGPVVASDSGFFTNWLNMVSETQAEQPHWISPLVTTSARLEQKIRYDQLWESSAGNHNLDSNGGGKGLEFIPFQNTEVIVGIPAYQTRNITKEADGFADENLLLKYRLLSANEENGDYILTAFLGLILPTGSDHNTGDHEVTTPTLAFGKGWGNFDFQSTLGISIPDNGAAHTGAGTPMLSNTAFQYRVFKYFSPEVEFNYSYWPNGDREGINQLYITPGIVLGKFDFGKRLALSVGVGCQIAATTKSQYNHNVIMSVRLSF